LRSNNRRAKRPIRTGQAVQNTAEFAVFSLVIRDRWAESGCR
jgi:hypothetical protein